MVRHLEFSTVSRNGRLCEREKPSPVSEYISHFPNEIQFVARDRAKQIYSVSNSYSGSETSERPFILKKIVSFRTGERNKTCQQSTFQSVLYICRRRNGGCPVKLALLVQFVINVIIQGWMFSTESIQGLFLWTYRHQGCGRAALGTFFISGSRLHDRWFRWPDCHVIIPRMENQGSDDAQQRDAILLRLLKTPPQPRPKRERDQKPSPKPRKESNRRTADRER